VIISESDYIKHYGTPRHSGRYPWGSGGASTTRNRSFLDATEIMRKQGMSDTEIARGMGLTTTQYRARRTIALAEKKQSQVNQATALREKGLSNVKIGEHMGLNESSVRALLAPGAKDKADVLHATADMLKKQVDGKSYIDIGTQVERALPLSNDPNVSIGISKDKFNTAVAMLQEQGYTIHYVKVQQLGTGNFTTIKVLAKPGTSYSEVFNNRSEIKQINDTYSEDGGRTYLGIQPPISVNARRVGINYAENGGSEADGVIYVRPGVKDLSIGNSNYAQVRIAVDGTHYLKGMAVYKEGLPAGTDLVFNTNKSSTGRKKDAMKEMEKDASGNVDPDNPFGAIVRQVHGTDGKVSSAMNIVNEEGDWDTWSRNLPSQMLSKQNPRLAKSQLDLTYERRINEYNNIKRLTNPTVRKKLLETFADETDSAAVHLKAAALPGQATRVLLPVKSMKPHEVYAPSFNNGTRVALIRYPHGGTFEIPQLTVNNRNKEAQKLLGKQTTDAIGIHHSVAQHLSGADFDGDYVTLIPNNRASVKSTPALEGLKAFDTKHSYPPYEGMRTIDGGIIKHGKVDYEGRSPIASRKQQEMGSVSNLITDMTIHGAKADELARAVRHSMVVIDAEKHNLDFKASERNNGIAQLKEKYQGGKRAGASTLISKAGAAHYIAKRKARPAAQGGPIDKATGKKAYVPTGELVPERKLRVNPATGKREYVRTGNMVPKMEKHERLAVTEDARKLVSEPSGTRVEFIYADHSNKLKGLANSARKEAVNTKPIETSSSAKKTYAPHVASLDAKLNLALKNAPLERQAQVIASKVVSQKRQAHPNMEAADVRKIKNQALAEARVRTGAKKTAIKPTQSEWDAIQAGAVSNHKLTQILNNGDLETIKKLATPKTQPKMTTTKATRAKLMLDSGYTQAEVASQLGVSVSTLKTAISEM
jgi:DNA-binding CsgD family transcriptional regulator